MNENIRFVRLKKKIMQKRREIGTERSSHSQITKGSNGNIVRLIVEARDLSAFCMKYILTYFHRYIHGNNIYKILLWYIGNYKTDFVTWFTK